MSIYNTEWNVIFNIGIKCNATIILNQAKMRYFSSPWDNMDSGYGLRAMADIMADGFDDYMKVEDWGVGNWYDYSVHNNVSNKINRKKMFYNKRYESSIGGWGMLNYPHLDYSWVKNKIGKRWFDRWQKHPSKSMNDWRAKCVWEGFTETFSRRQTRLKTIMESQNKILFLRLDDSRIYDPTKGPKHSSMIDTGEDIEHFVQTIGKAYPNLKFGYLHYFLDTDSSRSMKEITSDLCHVEKIPSAQYCKMDNFGRCDWIFQQLNKIKLLSRGEIKQYG